MKGCPGCTCTPNLQCQVSITPDVRTRRWLECVDLQAGVALLLVAVLSYRLSPRATSDLASYGNVFVISGSFAAAHIDGKEVMNESVPTDFVDGKINAITRIEDVQTLPIQLDGRRRHEHLRDIFTQTSTAPFRTLPSTFIARQAWVDVAGGFSLHTEQWHQRSIVNSAQAVSSEHRTGTDSTRLGSP